MPAALEKWPIKPDKARNSKAKSEEILSQTRINIVNSSSTRVGATDLTTAPAPKKIERHQQHSIWMAGCGSKSRLLFLNVWTQKWNVAEESMRARTYFKHDDVCVLQDCFCAVEHAALSTFDINLIIFVGL
jgi:hypothetical protein